MRLIVNGVDLAPYIEFQGVKWQRNDVDGPNAGRTLDATMHRDRVAVKMRLDCTCTPLTQEDAQLVLQTIAPEQVTVSYDDPQLGFREGVQMYSNNVPATYCIRKGTRDWWMGIAFPLIER